MFVPIWYGLNRPDISQFMEIINSTEEPMVQMELMKRLTGQHNPFTLMGGGLFHSACRYSYYCSVGVLPARC